MSAEGIGRTLQNGRRLFKQRLLPLLLLLPTFCNYSYSQYTCTSVCEHVNSLALGTRAHTSAPILSIQQFVRFEATILFDMQGNRRGLREACSTWETENNQRSLSYEVDPVTEDQAGAGNGLRASRLKDMHY